MRIGIFGGTFDPPHVGHQILAGEACDQLRLDRLLWVLTPYPPHKPGLEVTPLDQRLDLLQAALAGNPAFELSQVDIERPPPQYAVDTMRLLHSQYPGAELIYIMGGDSLRDLPSWHTPRLFLEACDGLGVMRRPTAELDLTVLEQLLPGITRKVSFVDAPLLEISSSTIRRRIAEGRTFRYYLPAPVYALIVARGLYREQASQAGEQRWEGETPGGEAR